MIIKRAPGATASDLSILGPHNGRFYVRRHGDKLVVQAWPRKRGKPKSATTLTQNEFMKTLASYIKLANNIDVTGAHQFAYGSHYVWRDIIARMMVGRFINVGQEDLMTPQEILDAITSEVGSVLYRSPDGWIGLPPGLFGQVLSVGIGQTSLIWVDQSGGGGGGDEGLYGPVMSDLPTQSTTGLTTWLNQVSATAADTPIGICITSPNAGAVSLQALTKLAPAAPYTVTALLAQAGAATNNGCGIGWYDGSSKLQVISPGYGASGFVVGVQRYSSPTAFSSSDKTTATVSQPIWLQLHDDSATVFFNYSQDGANFRNLYSVAKSSGYLGSSGYSNIVFFNKPQSEASVSTLMSYLES